LLILLEYFSGSLRIRIGQGDDIFRVEGCDVIGCPASRADAGDVQFFVRGFVTQPAKRRGTSESRRRNRAGEKGSKEKMPPGNWFV